MPARNLVLLVVVTIGCVAAWFSRERETRGRRLNEVLAIVDAAYIEPIDPESLEVAAMDGAVSVLDDNSAFVRGDEQWELETALDQRFGGVGLELAIDRRTGELTVETVLPEGPAWRGGIMAGDRIKAIDGDTASGMPLAEAVTRLRGRPGEPVTLGVAGMPAASASDPATAVRDVRLVREIVLVESVQGDRRRPDGSWDWRLEGEPGIVFLRITGFGERTAEELDAALAQVAAEQTASGGPPTPLRGLVIDLRGNPGGLITSAVDVCDRFLDDGVIVSTRGRRGSRGEAPLDVRRATPGAVCADVPIAVLVDGMTASAAEIVAACLQDRGRATVVGGRTFGKGTVQSILPLSGGGLLKLTTSEYLRPSGAGIHRRPDDGDDATWGVMPDAGCTIVPTQASVERLTRWRQRRDAVGPIVPDDPSSPAPRAVDEVLARALDAMRVESRPGSDLGGEEETSRHADDAGPSGV
jgi:carboxyl-terminal processing protease